MKISKTVMNFVTKILVFNNSFFRFSSSLKDIQERATKPWQIPFLLTGRTTARIHCFSHIEVRCIICSVWDHVFGMAVERQKLSLF